VQPNEKMDFAFLSSLSMWNTPRPIPLPRTTGHLNWNRVQLPIGHRSKPDAFFSTGTEGINNSPDNGETVRYPASEMSSSTVAKW
jgi:hypothetical protein